MSAKRKNRGLRSLVIIIFSVVMLCILGGGGYMVYRILRPQEDSAKGQELDPRQEEAYKREAGSVQKEYNAWKETVEVDTIYPGISAMGVDLSGRTQEEARMDLETAFRQQVLEKTMTLTWKDQTWKYTFEDLGFSSNAAEVAAEAFGINREGNIKQRYEALKDLKEDPVELEIQITGYDEAVIDEILGEIAGELEVAPQNAEMTFSNGKYTVKDGKNGRKLQIKNARKAILENLELGESFEVTLKTKKVEPEYSTKYFKEAQSKIGTFHTEYDLYNTARNTNLEVGCAHINNMVLMPGEVFNYNEIVSPVDEAGGYKEASTISNGQYVPGFGGGLCQVSTTLYGAVIRAELEIVERYPHSLEPGYVPNGMDAAMSIGGKNFQFRNSTDYPICIVMSAKDGILSATIYGYEEHDKSRKVSFEQEKTGSVPKPDPIYTDDDTLPEGEEEVESYGKEGSKYDVYKVIEENGTTTREYFSSSTYYSTADRIRRGTKSED